MFVFANTPGAIFGNVSIARLRENGHKRQSDAAGVIWSFRNLSAFFDRLGNSEWVFENGLDPCVILNSSAFPDSMFDVKTSFELTHQGIQLYNIHMSLV